MIKSTLNFLLFSLFAISSAFPSTQGSKRVESGYVASNDGIRLSYTKVGSGPVIVIIPARLFLFPDFEQLAKGRTIIAYDMRNRGRSDAVTDNSKIGMQQDADDLEAIRAHFGANKADLIGWSYLGKLVILYATQHPEHVNRIVQIGPVAHNRSTKFPEDLTSGDSDKVPDPAEIKKLDQLFDSGFIKDHPRESCEMEWKIEQQRMVGNPENAGRIASPCEMKNEWYEHLFPHFRQLVGSDISLHISTDSIAKVTMPVLTIHGTKDRNAPYGGGREWDMLLPNARLITLEGAAHACWIEFPQIAFPDIDRFLNGDWPKDAEQVKTLERKR